MKKNLKGFTLAELLLCLAIIGIVTAFGATAIKQSTEKAYQKYWKTGYVGLHDAIATVIEQDPNREIIRKSGRFIYRLSKVISGKPSMAVDQDLLTNNDESWFAAPNGILYRFAAGGINGVFIIEMMVPQQKNKRIIEKKDGYAGTRFYVNINGNGCIVPLPIPYSSTAFQKIAINNKTARYVDLQNRVDILPFYADDFRVGRVIIDEETNTRSYEKITPKSYKEVACAINGNLTVKITSWFQTESSEASSEVYWDDTGSDNWDISNAANQKLTRILNCGGLPQKTETGSIIRVY